MMLSNVTHQIALLSELVLTYNTHKRLRSSVDIHVINKVTCVAETPCFRAYVTRVRLIEFLVMFSHVL